MCGGSITNPLKMWHSSIWGTTAGNKNLIHLEIKKRVNSGNAYYQSVQNILSLRLLYKNVKIMILPMALNECETWYLALREEHKLKMFAK
jgi:hypothetical protein